MRDDPDTLMIFAAGLGSRMAPLTDHQPKPLIEIAGKPLIDHAIDLAHTAQISRIFANTHYLADQLQDHLTGLGVQTIHEERLLETGGGLKNAMPLLKRDIVLTLNSDAVWKDGSPIDALLRRWDGTRMDALLCLIPPENAAGHTGAGNFAMDMKGKLCRAPGLVYSGLQIIKTNALRRIQDPVFSLNLLWDRMITSGRLFGTIYDGRWCDVGRPESIATAEAMLDV